MRKTIHVISIMHNEEFILPYFLKHYEFADRITIFNDHSTDRTAEIASSDPFVELHDYRYDGLKEHEFNSTFEKAAKDSDCDWVMCVDADEFITGDLPDVSGVVLKTVGYTMVGRTGRLEDCKKVRTPMYDKPVVFDPTLNVNFGAGRHTINMKPMESKLELLHYKYLSREYYERRAREIYPRIMDQRTMDYRIRRGLEWYDNNVK